MMGDLPELYRRLGELEGQREEVMAVRVGLVAEVKSLPDGTPIEPWARALAEVAEALRQIDVGLRSLRHDIICERLGRGDSPDAPGGVVCLWWPFLGPGSP